MRKFLSMILVVSLATLTSACVSYYKMDIQQGNVVTQEMIARLKPDMSKRQVRYVLGTPLVHDPFHDDRWDYVYTFKKGGAREPEKKALIVFFQNDRLQRVEQDGVELDLSRPAAMQTGDGPQDDTDNKPTVVKGDAETLEQGKKGKKKGFLRRSWDKIWGND
jgi:outer membrane protein assembly factor BamE